MGRPRISCVEFTLEIRIYTGKFVGENAFFDKLINRDLDEHNSFKDEFLNRGLASLHCMEGHFKLCFNTSPISVTIN